MRRIKTQEEIALEKQRELGLLPTIMPTSKLLLIYARQSTEGQTVDHPQSALQQTKDTIEYGRSLGWEDENIMLFVENQLIKSGKISDASGSLRIDQRPGLQEIVSLIETGKAGAVLVRSEDRLFRDQTHIQDAIFADVCKRHHVLIFTLKTVYDFNNPSRGDYDRFLDAAKTAANYLKHIRDTLLAGKARKILVDHQYPGGGVPTGLMLNKTRSAYVDNPVWMPTIKALFARFRQLDGNFSALRHEILGKPIFKTLPEEFLKSVGYIHLTPVEGGYTINGYEALKGILTNVAYIGHTIYNGVLIKNTHAQFINDEDFFFAFNRLSSVDLDGNPINREKKAIRFKRGEGARKEVLFAGVRRNGKPCITSHNRSVYVFWAKRASGKAEYTIKDLTSIDASFLDTLFANRLLEHMARAKEQKQSYYGKEIPENILAKIKQDEFGARVLRGVGTMRDVMGSNFDERAMLQHLDKLEKETTASVVSVDSGMKKIKARIAELKHDLNLKTLHPEDREDIYSTLNNLRKQLSDLERKKSEADTETSFLREISGDVHGITEQWEKLPLEKKQRFIRLVTDSIMLDKIGNKWLMFTVTWSRIITGDMEIQHSDICLIWRRYLPGSSDAWNKEEEKILMENYPTMPRSKLLDLLPSRTWVAICNHAKSIGLQREYYQFSDTDIPVDLSKEDRAIAEKYGIDLLKQPAIFWWREFYYMPTQTIDELLVEQGLIGATLNHLPARR